MAQEKDVKPGGVDKKEFFEADIKGMVLHKTELNSGVLSLLFVERYGSPSVESGGVKELLHRAVVVDVIDGKMMGYEGVMKERYSQPAISFSFGTTAD